MEEGAVIRHEDGQRAEVVDYRQYHLKPPPRGYEWRLVDGQYVLVNSSNFHISMVVRVRKHANQGAAGLPDSAAPWQLKSQLLSCDS